MTRLTRDEAQAETRRKLVTAAGRLFAQRGYAATSLDAIAAEAGFTKGAVYANFRCKEAVFLAALDQYGTAALESLLAALEGISDAATAVALIAQWAEQRAEAGDWPALLLEQGRLMGESCDGRSKAEALFRGQWEPLGRRLAPFTRAPADDPIALGALVFELAHAPAIRLVRSPGPGALLRLALGALFGLSR